MIVMQDEELLTLQEVATRLKVSPDTVKRFIDANKLEAIRIGDRWRVKAGEVERYIAHNTKKRQDKK